MSVSSDPSQQSGTPSHVQDVLIHSRLPQVNSSFLQVPVFQKRTQYFTVFMKVKVNVIKLAVNFDQAVLTIMVYSIQRWAGT